MEVGKNALDSLKSSLNKYLIPEYSIDELELGKQDSKILTARQNLINQLNEISQALSKKGTTIISQSNDDLPFNLDVIALTK